jgi:hypothetical protein
MMNNTGFKVLGACKRSQKRLFSEHFNLMSVLVGNMLENDHIPYLTNESVYIL